ncbi:MAG: hypothetical protein PUP93_29960, partial [Rhizonema sp. NSF051]|nr:hypothetical protein [Rhizonema sp. NSF051]
AIKLEFCRHIIMTNFDTQKSQRNRRKQKKPLEEQKQTLSLRLHPKTIALLESLGNKSVGVETVVKVLNESPELWERVREQFPKKKSQIVEELEADQSLPPI